VATCVFILRNNRQFVQKGSQILQVGVRGVRIRTAIVLFAKAQHVEMIYGVM
jgi:hypothetical protein